MYHRQKLILVAKLPSAVMVLYRMTNVKAIYNRSGCSRFALAARLRKAGDHEADWRDGMHVDRNYVRAHPWTHSFQFK